MADDMLMCFDSPLNPPRVASRTVGMTSPLIPCPTFPFDIVAETAALEADPFERVLKSALRQTPAKAVSLPGSPTSPKHMRGLRQDSVLDISAALAERCLVSSTPNPFARDKGVPPSPFLDSTQGTPTRRQHSARRSVMNNVMEMSADHIRMIVQKKMERLQALNQNLSSAGGSNLRRSLSTSDLPQGLRMQTHLSATESLNASRECGINEMTYNKYSMSIINESARSLGDGTNDSTPIKISALKKEALKLSSIFQNITVDLDDGSDDTLGTPIKEKTKRRYSESFAGNYPESPEDLRSERPPWEWDVSSSEDEDGLPKIMRLRVSAKKHSCHSPDTTSLLSRYHKTRNSLQYDDCKESEVSQSHPASQADTNTEHNGNGTGTVTVNAPEPVPTTTTTVPLVIQQTPIPGISLADLKPKTATTNVVKKGPLKAMMPLPSMMKARMPPSAQVPNAKLNYPAPRSSIQGPRGRDKDVLGPVRRSNSGSALIHKQPYPINAPSPKQTLTSNDIVERPSSAPSPCKGVLEALTSVPVATRKGTLLKKRPPVAPGKENLAKK